jgi:multiple sugar transport system substrate-binding protein
MGFDPEDRETVEIDFWHVLTGAQREGLREMIDAFHASQSYVNVNEVVKNNYAQLSSHIDLNERAGLLPHVAQTSVANVVRYMNSRMILPLNPFMNARDVGMTQEEIDDIVHGFRAVSEFDGIWYSLPFNKSVRVLYYNRDLLNAHNVAVPETWAELERAARLLTDEDAYRVGLGFEDALDFEWVSLLFQRGGTFFDESAHRAVFASPEGIDAMKYLMNFINNPYTRTAEADLLPDLFGSGGIAMFLGSSALIPRVASVAGNNLNWGTTLYPSTDGVRSSEFSGDNIVLFENVSHSINERVGAWEFMRYTLNPQTAARWAMASGYLPVSYTAADLSVYRRHLGANPPAQAPVQMLPDGFYRIRISSGDYIRDILLEETNEIRQGTVYAEEGLIRAEDRINEELAIGR